MKLLIHALGFGGKASKVLECEERGNQQRSGTVQDLMVDACDSALWRLRQENCESGITGLYHHAQLPSVFFKEELRQKVDLGWNMLVPVCYPDR